MQTRSQSPFAARPFAARASIEYPSSLKKTMSLQQSYYSMNDPHLVKYYAAKASKTLRRSSLPSPSRPSSRTSLTRQKTRQSLKNPKSFVSYLIAVRTGSGTDNGTSARIFVTLYGTQRKVGRQRLTYEGEANCVFDPGSLKKFRIAVEESKDIGDLKYVTIEVCLIANTPIMD